MKDWVITSEAFELFLAWLAPDREEAGQKYEALRRRLIVFFECRGCIAAEELADETINRVIRRLPDIRDNYAGDPARYFYGVARYVHLEQSERDGRSEPLPDILPEIADKSGELKGREERALSCLEACLGRLSADDRQLVIRYYHRAIAL